MMPGVVPVQVGLLLVMPSAAPRKKPMLSGRKSQLSRQIGSVGPPGPLPRRMGEHIAQQRRKKPVARRLAGRLDRRAGHIPDRHPATPTATATRRAKPAIRGKPRRGQAGPPTATVAHGQPPAIPARAPAKNHPVVGRWPKGMAVAIRRARKIRERRRGRDYVPTATPCQGRMCHCATAVSAVACIVGSTADTAVARCYH